MNDYKNQITLIVGIIVLILITNHSVQADELTWNSDNFDNPVKVETSCSVWLNAAGQGSDISPSIIYEMEPHDQELYRRAQRRISLDYSKTQKMYSEFYLQCLQDLEQPMHRVMKSVVIGRY